MFVSLDILGPLLRTNPGNQYVLVITERDSKMTRDLSMWTSTVSYVANIFLED